MMEGQQNQSLRDYTKIRTVGRGAYGIVNLYRKKSDGSLNIIKEIPVEEMTLEERQGALTEVKVLDMLNHPNVVKYYDSFFEDKALMIVMEYAEGGTIFEYLQSRGGELLAESEVMHLFVQIVLSLQGIHSHNILHRDLKTQNIMLDRDHLVVKVGDFGISKVLTSKSKANTVVGTPCYISPELCEGKPYNQKSDIWALGCVLYEVASLRKAFDAANLPALVLKIMRGIYQPISDTYSEDLRKLILSMLHLMPEERPGLDQILALPICQQALMDLHCGIGKLKPFGVSESFASRADSGSDSFLTSTLMSNAEPVNTHIPSIVTWGMDTPAPLLLLGYEKEEIPKLCISRTQHVVVYPTGEVSAWKTSHVKRISQREDQSDPRFMDFRPMPGLDGIVIKQVAFGASFAAFSSDRGILMTLGNGAQGCLGHGDYDDCDSPRIVESILGCEVSQISAGSAHMAVVTSEGQVYSWGSGDNGRLALGNDDHKCSPQEVTPPNGSTVGFVHCADDCTFFLTTKNMLLASGSNRFNKAGLREDAEEETSDDSTNGSSSLMKTMLMAQEAHWMMPVKALGLNVLVAKIATGQAHTAIVTTTGSLYTFGSNSHGQLGRPISTDEPCTKPCLVQHVGDNNVKLIACGDNFTLAATKDNKLYGWGRSTEGRLPQQSQAVVPLPVQIHLRSVCPGIPKEHTSIEAVCCKFNVAFACVAKK
eukprot:m.212373 g.212373  ORF g.212373 m.212373 type:complete len:708 (-) comp33125_c0_seq1:92-2215(-)